ncbi:putative RNA 2'-phosphotransferase [Archangium gephyra]|uniref:RNA 2'-phosphotransferase n=1 Tax=Archangium gephyra TaxID=48 RepID=A0AAC8THQ3_9BACT|nr:tRNA 2'-phosphotransferase [Archangium gephyra]AKJ06105.1 RNA:NAD 2'-phosphotransferase [Archangium gephyra]REG27141.1 putative RNA 2'-phosphotransferase [Archangium gephyra]
MFPRHRAAPDSQALVAKSKKLSWLLRHGARESGLSMDEAGFASVADVLRLTGLSRAQLEAVVADNSKSRFELKGERMRAVQGHSPEGTPVTLDGLERSWEVVLGDAPLYHGTSVVAARSILDSAGVHAASRSHVHLAPAVDATVGKRAGVDVLLVVCSVRLRAAGLSVFRAPNGVLLARAVPREAVTDLLAATAAGERALGELRRRLTS